MTSRLVLESSSHQLFFTVVCSHNTWKSIDSEIWTFIFYLNVFCLILSLCIVYIFFFAYFFSLISLYLVLSSVCLCVSCSILLCQFPYIKVIHVTQQDIFTWTSAGRCLKEFSVTKDVWKRFYWPIQAVTPGLFQLPPRVQRFSC